VTPRLSILIASHNRPDLLRLCLSSVKEHSRCVQEILVVDDASCDAIVSRTALAFPEVRVLRLDQRSGFCVAMNRGMAQVSGDVVELLNDDTEVTCGWDTAAVQHFADPKIVAVSPLVLQGPPGAIVPERIDSAGDDWHSVGFARKRFHGQLLTRTLVQSQRVTAANGTASFFRRSSFLSVGGLPAEFGAYFDDVDLSLRLRKSGGEIVVEPQSRIYHRISSSYGPPKGELLQQQSRNEEMVFWRNTSGGQLISLLPGHVALLMGKAWRRLNEGTLREWSRGRWNAWKYRFGIKDSRNSA
jgi:hypothetical protein